MKLISLLALALGMSMAQAVTINAVYFGQTHMLKATDSYFGLVGNREAFIKVHVTDPAAPASPTVTATLSLAGNTNVLTLTGPATLPTSIPDGLGVVQHSKTNTFTGVIPAAWVKKGLTINVNAGTASTNITNIDIGAPTKVIMTMTDVQYFADTNGDYPSGIFSEIEAKWPVADLEVRRLGHVVFPELVIPPRSDVGSKAVRIKSKAEYFVKTGLSFDGEQSAALAWNGALKRAAGRSGRWSLYYLNVYNAYAGGQAGGFAGVGNGTDVGILHHELGHALSLPHWGDNAGYPYKGDMYGIQAPSNYNGTHAGPAWAFHLPTRAFIPPTTQAGNVGGKPVGTYKVDPMQGGGEGWQEPAYLLNHFSDYSVNQMRDYLTGHVVVWNATLNSWAQWNQTAGDYTTTVSNNGVQFPTTRDTQVISIMASLSGANPSVNMVYPPIGPYTAGLIRLFDPSVAADRTAAQSIYAPSSGCDYCVRVVQGGVTKTYMLAASNLSTADPYAESSLITEAINLPASGGAVTKIELLSTPNAEDNGLPATPTVLYTWAPLMPEPGAFDQPPTANGSNAITMTALPGEVAFGQTGGTIEYQFTETTGNPGATNSAWQTSRTYTDTGLTAGTTYSYTVAVRAGTLATTASAPASATTTPPTISNPITVVDTQSFTLGTGSGYKAISGIGTFDPGGADKLVVVIAGENANNDHFAFAGVRYNGVAMTEIVQQTGITADGAVAIYYMDNPPAIGSITVSGYNLNGGLGVAYALNGTKPGFGGAFTSRKGSYTTSVPLTTSAANSLVIAALQNSGNPNGAGTPAATAPLTQTIGTNWSGWGALASGYVKVASPSNAACAFTTSTSGTHSINLASVEILAATTPASTWTQTAGGAQAWTTAANWIANSVPTPISGETVDFSSVNIAANTTLTLGADRTGGLWKFGDSSGSQSWTVNSGNTITLAGPTPTIEVVKNITQLNCIVAGTAGLIKTGAGNLTLTAANTYTGATTVTEGRLQIGSGGTTGSLAATSAITNDATITFNRSNTITQGTDFASVIAGTGSLTQSGTGTLILSGDNTYTGTTTISTGTLQIGNGGTTGKLAATSVITNNAALVFNRGNSITQGSGFANGITGTGSLSTTGVGTLTLNSSNTYAGLTTVSAGSLKVLAADALGTTAAGTVVNGTSTGSTSNARLELEGGITVTGEILTLNGIGNFYGALSSTNGTNTWASNITIGSAGTRLGATTGNTLVVSGIIDSGVTNTGLVIRTQDLTSPVILSGANTYLGDTNLVVGELQLAGGDNRLPVTSILTMGNSTNPTEFDLNGRNQEIAGLTINAGATAANNAVNNSSVTLSTLKVNTTSPSTFAGVLKGNLALTKSGTSTLTLSGLSATAANNFTGRTIIDQGTLAIASTNPSFTGGITFGLSSGSANTGGLDLSASSATFAGSATVVTNSSTANLITIGSGRTLTLNSGLTIGYDAGSGATGALPTVLDVDGSGSMSVNGTTINVGVNQAAAVNQVFWNDATLDVSGLAAFNTNVTTFNIGVGAQTQGPGTVLLSNTANTILATTLVIGDTGINNGRGPGTLRLGTGTNLIQADTIQIGRGKGSGNGFVNFASQTSGSPGTVTIVNKAGSGAANITVGDNGTSTNTASGVSGTLDLRGHAATITAGSLVIGKNNMTNNLGVVTGTVSFDAGTFTANTVSMAAKTGASTGAANATLNIGGGSFTVNSGGVFTLASQATAGTANGTLNLTGGTLTSNADIVDGGGTTTTTITLNGGTLDMTGKNLGGATAIDNLNFQSGTLRNVASINSSGGLTKTTSGTLTLAGTNGYSGVTNVSAGVISLGSASALGSTAGNTVVASGAEIFAGTAVANTTIAEPFNISGTGITGAIHIGNSITGITFSGAIALNADARIQSDASTSSAFSGAINTNGFALTFNGPGTVAVNATGITGNGSFIKSSAGTIHLNIANTFTGATTIDAGTCNLNALNALGSTSGISITSGAILQEQEISGSLINDTAAITVNGAFELDKNETIGSLAGAGTVTAKDLNNDNSAAETWTLTLGGNNANSSFSGILQDNGADAKLLLTKIGTGNQTLAGANTYTGNTLISAGTLTLADNAQLMFVLGSSSGSNNNITGAGTLVLNGVFVIDTTAADALASGSWTLENVPSLSGPYGNNFSVVGFANAGNNKWTKANGTKLYTFDETTGILTLAPAATYSSWISGFFPGETNPAIIGINADPDNDGIKNGVELVLGGNPASTMDTALLPTISLVTNPVGSPAIPPGSYMLFTYRRSDLSVTAGVTASCETAVNLTGLWTTATNGVSGVVIQVDDDHTFTPAVPDTDRVRVYIPRGADTVKFGRLKALVP